MNKVPSIKHQSEKSKQVDPYHPSFFDSLYMSRHAKEMFEKALEEYFEARKEKGKK